MSNPTNSKDDTDQNIELLRWRVRSFASDPLHSAAYLSNLSNYMNKSSRGSTKQNRYQRPVHATENCNTFLYVYDISNPTPSKPIIYESVSSFLSSADSAKPAPNKSELIFLTGYPSPEWLNAVVSRFGLDQRFLHRHLDFLPNGQRDWYTSPDVPSRSKQFIRILIPSIIFLGPEGRYVSPQDLHKARNTCTEQLRQTSKSFFGGSQSGAGRSIFRHVNIHSGDAIVVEQAITITILDHENGKKRRYLYHHECKSSNLTPSISQ